MQSDAGEISHTWISGHFGRLRTPEQLTTKRAVISLTLAVVRRQNVAFSSKQAAVMVVLKRIWFQVCTFQRIAPHSFELVAVAYVRDQSGAFHMKIDNYTTVCRQRYRDRCSSAMYLPTPSASSTIKKIGKTRL